MEREGERERERERGGEEFENSLLSNIHMLKS